MKIYLNGEFEVSAPPEETFAFIATPDRFAPVLPYFKELKNNVEGFIVVLEVGVPQVRGIVEVDTLLVEQQPSEHVVYKARGHHALGMMDSVLTFDVAPTTNGSIVRWQTKSTISGTLVSLANGILLPLAKRQIKSLVASVQASLGATGESAAPRSPTMLSRSRTSLRGLFGSAAGNGTESS
jgi:carbon monoxide dehydrogenase subunit G